MTTKLKDIVDKVIGSVEFSKDAPAFYVIKDKEGRILIRVNAEFCFDKDWNWFDNEGVEDDNIAD
jgi:hypothetical protein